MTKYTIVISEEQRLLLTRALATGDPEFADLFDMLYELPDVEKQAPAVVHDLTA